MYLGLVCVQLFFCSDGYCCFIGLLIDVLVYFVGLSCQILIWFVLCIIIYWCVVVFLQWWFVCWGDVWGGRFYFDVVQDVVDFGVVGDEGNDVYLFIVYGVQQWKCFVDVGNQYCL